MDFAFKESVETRTVRSYTLETETIEELIRKALKLEQQDVSFDWDAHSGCVYRVRVTSVRSEFRGEIE